MIGRLLRAAVRDILALVGRRIDRRVCAWTNQTGGDDEVTLAYLRGIEDAAKIARAARETER